MRIIFEMRFNDFFVCYNVRPIRLKESKKQPCLKCKSDKVICCKMERKRIYRNKN